MLRNALNFDENNVPANYLWSGYAKDSEEFKDNNIIIFLKLKLMKRSHMYVRQ